MIVKILIAFGLALTVLALVAIMQPPTYHVERSATISAAPSKVFAMINDFHQWEAWSPWAKIDPAMKLDIRDSTYTWSGNDKAGAGTMTRTQSQPDENVGVHLEFTKPYATTSDIAFQLKPIANGTAITWTMDGRNNFLLKAMSLFSSMDKMIGPDFDKGLAQLKAAAEKGR